MRIDSTISLNLSPVHYMGASDLQFIAQSPNKKVCVYRTTYGFAVTFNDQIAYVIWNGKRYQFTSTSMFSLPAFARKAIREYPHIPSIATP